VIERQEYAEEEFGLQQYLDIIRQRRWTILYTVVAVVVAGAVATALMTPIYQAQAKLLVRASAPQVSAVNTENPLVDLLAMAQPESIDTQIEVLESQPFLKEVYAAAHVPEGKRRPRIRVNNVKDTNVIDVTVEGPDPEMAARVANTMLKQYLDRTTVLSLQEITRAREFVQGEAKKASSALQSAEDALLEFRRDNRVAELTAEQQNRTQQLVDLETKAREVENNIVRVQAQMRQVQAQLRQQPRERVVYTSQENPRVNALKAKLAEATVERDMLLKQYRPGSSKVRLVEATMASLQKQLESEPLEERIPLHAPNERHQQLAERLDGYQTELEGLEAQRAQLVPELDQQRGRLNQLGPWEVRLAQLQRDRDMAEKSYLNLAGKLQDLQIRENARRSTARIIERAAPPGAPIRPRKATNIALSLALGILLGGCLAFVLEALDDRITTPEEVDRLLGLPVLGHIPAIAGERRLIHALPPHSPVAESYRSLRSSISFSAIDAPVTTLGVSSARASEGKSTTAFNLALAMAMDGRQVILVDADLRRPSLHRLLALGASPGLTDVLTGNCALEDALRATPDCPLLVLTSGPIPPNPAELLNTSGMENLIAQLRAMADVVIFDTPPCLPVTDSQVLGARLDGMLLVAQMGEARKAEVRRARELLDQAHIRVLGVVFNKINSQSSGYYYRNAYYRSEYAPDALRNGHGNGAGHDPGRPDNLRLPKLVGRRGGESGKDDED
jgi:capsular exopolysaccharide synthesis family protein